MNRITYLFKQKPKNVCSIFVTAGFPNLEDTVQTVLDLEKSGVDMVEIGMPFSDPLADGETIQASSIQALENGMTIDLIFRQIVAIRAESQIPIVLMGYFNPVFKFGLDLFLNKCQMSGVDGLIIPDISIEEYELNYKEVFAKYDVPLTFLVTPKTSTQRLSKIKGYSSTFIYYVSSASTTGKTGEFSEDQISDFKRMSDLRLEIPVLMGFGIHNTKTFDIACQHFDGGIIGSAFIRHLKEESSVQEFCESLKISQLY
ncbi:MAG: tryptophan synthase alpha chain [Arenicella sp.]|jgi:tryptophan synthase alpha chain